jgi:hypothetical protein
MCCNLVFISSGPGASGGALNLSIQIKPAKNANFLFICPAKQAENQYMFILMPLGIIMLAVVIYLAVSKQSAFIIRIAALIALALMILSVIICMFVAFFSGGGQTDDTFAFVPTPVPPPAKSEGNTFMLLGFVFFLIALFVVVLFMSLKEYRKNK